MCITFRNECHYIYILKEVMSNSQLKALEGRRSIVKSRGTPGNYFIVGEMDEANKTHLFPRAKSAIFF